MDFRWRTSKFRNIYKCKQKPKSSWSYLNTAKTTDFATKSAAVICKIILGCRVETQKIVKYTQH